MGGAYLRLFGFVFGSDGSARENPRRNLTGGPYLTDGLRLIAFLSKEAIPTDQVKNVHWADTAKDRVERGQTRDDP